MVIVIAVEQIGTIGIIRDGNQLRAIGSQFFHEFFYIARIGFQDALCLFYIYDEKFSPLVYPFKFDQAQRHLECARLECELNRSICFQVVSQCHVIWISISGQRRKINPFWNRQFGQAVVVFVVIDQDRTIYVIPKNKMII